MIGTQMIGAHRLRQMPVITRKTYSGTAQKAGNETLAMTRAARVSKAATPYSR
jgi:hypothetical protein